MAKTMYDLRAVTSEAIPCTVIVVYAGWRKNGEGRRAIIISHLGQPVKVVDFCYALPEAEIPEDVINAGQLDITTKAYNRIIKQAKAGNYLYESDKDCTVVKVQKKATIQRFSIKK
jgi:hypothetical protein